MITNIRLGLATNSSSSHSLVWVPQDVTRLVQDEDADGQFGWNYFTCASETAKKIYMGVGIASLLNRTGDLDEQTAKHVLGQLFELDEDAVDKVWSGYIDHDSEGTLHAPFSLPELLAALEDGDEAFEQFAQSFKEGIKPWLSPHWVVAGGNDNDNAAHFVAALGIPAEQVAQLGRKSTLKVRKDEKQGFVTVFNPNTGAKLRVSLDAEREAVPEWEVLEHYEVQPTKSSVPELADIKITDYCPYGCAYCYQGSTPEGAHASTDFLDMLAAQLGKAGVFEVAFGGGEPTLHPQFVEILEQFRSVGVVPNFTTRNLAWLKSAPKAARILAACGAFAVSVEKAETVHQLAQLLEPFPVKLNDKVAVQLVMGTQTREVVGEILTACGKYGFRVTLLGYKLTGRGICIVPQPYDWWLDEVTSEHRESRPAVSIDTALASQYQVALENRKVSKRLYHTEEGKFSVYFDAVAKTIAPSSYCDAGQHAPFDEATWLSRFAAM